ncbi:uncharacterized protein G2W53_011537 [Senna tora]|uniref:Uncharacterized protein n=1 Tax=Senna tora TaxID=362788 RepID=A0A834X1G6_9FABA|nr:uncharacterized protein G2W53_011537 [Senna tora]
MANMDLTTQNYNHHLEKSGKAFQT